MKIIIKQLHHLIQNFLSLTSALWEGQEWKIIQKETFNIRVGSTPVHGYINYRFCFDKFDLYLSMFWMVSSLAGHCYELWQVSFLISRLFACMNPATDAGKRPLPSSLRTRFTEFLVEETGDPVELARVVAAYLPAAEGQPLAEKIVKFYLEARKSYPDKFRWD